MSPALARAPRDVVRVLVLVAAVVTTLAGAGSATAADGEGHGELRRAAEAAGVEWGAAVNPVHFDAPGYLDAARDEFTMLVPENHLKFPYVHPAPGVYDFTEGDRIADLARANGQTMRGTILIWREDHIDEEFVDPDAPDAREQAIALMREHIHTVLGHYRDHYPDVVTQWDVVNEAYRQDGTLRDSDWHRLIGDDFIELAFEFAHEAWPELELTYLDFYEASFSTFGSFIEASGEVDLDGARPGLGSTAQLSSCDTSAKCSAVRAMVTDFVERGVPIDVVGFQGHIANAVAPDYRELASWVGDLGLEWTITELDAPCHEDPTGECATNQADRYRTVVAACVTDPACDTVVQWGVADPFSWWHGLTAGSLGEALALDDDFSYKPAADAVVEVLRAAADPASDTGGSGPDGAPPSPDRPGADPAPDPPARTDPALPATGGGLGLLGLLVLLGAGRLGARSPVRS